MTVIAWDGRYLAIDAAGIAGGFTYRTKKMDIVCNKPPTVLAISGFLGHFEVLKEWYLEKGAVYAERPDFQKAADWSRLIVLEDGRLKWYEDTGPVYLHYPEQKMAFGCGRDFAIGAMAAGADAETAIRITCQNQEGCGKGVDVYDSYTHTLKRSDL